MDYLLSKHQRAAAVLTVALSLCGTAWGDTVTFTVAADSLNTTINSLTAGQAATENSYTCGILFDITQYNGVSTPLQTIGYCSELAQNVSPGVTYTYSITPLAQLDAATAGQTGTASSAIPAGGIGALAAAQLNYLYDNHYAGTSTAAWTRTTATPDTLAFQLAQWEITHGSNLDLSDPTGTLYVDWTANSSALNTNTLNLAQTWLTDIKNAGIVAGYQSQNWDVIGLSDPTSQDLIIATAKGALVTVPEPGSLLLAASGIILLFRRRHRLRD